MSDEIVDQMAAEAAARLVEEEWADGWEPYDERPELAESRRVAAAGGRGQLDHGGRAAAYPAAPRRPVAWYDLDAATAAALMVLGIVAVPVVAVAVWVGRRFRVVRR